jgi:hypothetical protein
MCRIISVFLRQETIAVGEASIKNGSVCDPDGVIATAVLAKTTMRASFNNTALTLCTSEIHPRMLLAAFNVSIAGMVSLPADFHTESVNLKLNHKRFSVRHTAAAPLLPCVGVAIVRAVDIENKSLLLIPTTFNRSSDDDNDILLVRSNTQLPMVLQYTPGQPCYPYITGEIEGEGSAVMKARTNLKRKWHTSSG